VEDKTRTVSEELLSDKNIRKAVDLCEKGAFTPAELATYEKYWDIISTASSKLLINRTVRL
jgi:hypothetical protein